MKVTKVSLIEQNYFILKDSLFYFKKWEKTYQKYFCQLCLYNKIKLALKNFRKNGTNKHPNKYKSKISINPNIHNF